ncbi:aminotransferase class IV [Rhodobacter sp. ETT8]|uniref:Aminotransferase class IV n=1 Tax=Pseudotabrizicola algicola TaxID=2709381 RepID=A0A6B3RPD4_9RHOB|nr:aminotransferase class IV [Pseudotabrizicola algicola]NEX47083.1 aminotransferase class IV [Pseudotabrizicola algicola]
MLWDGGSVPRGPLHLARLRAGASALGWAVPELRLAGPEGQAARLRLTLDAAGDVALEVGAVPAPIACWRLGLAAERLHSGDPWLRVKSTRRPAYDRARAALPAGLDEVVFVNERGEVCDGSITTLFFDRGAGLRTPPLSSGLLPGVLRAEVCCPEEVLLAEDLPRVRLWVGNALRGMAEAVWLG